MPCPCSGGGSLNADPCDTPCNCKVKLNFMLKFLLAIISANTFQNTLYYVKVNVEGTRCDRCKKGYFNLRRDSGVGCEKCYCSNLTDICDSAILSRYILTLCYAV